jgi:GTP-binding protein EngB required for normal cell division
MITPLDETRRTLLADERRLLGELRDWLVRLEAPEDERRALADSIEQLEQPFLLVVVGEFNAGKSVFINALLGQAALKEGVTPTTARIGLLGHGDSVSGEVTAEGLERLTAPAEILRDLVIVDTPGTNAVLREHEALTRDFVPRADLVLFVTSSDRPFTESERSFLETIRTWGKKVIVVLNKVDLLETPQDVTRVVDYVREQVQRTLGFAPDVFPVSARQALRARLEGDDATVETSGLPAFETRVTAALDETERFRLKLLNPLGVGRRVHGELATLVEGRLGVLGDDLRALDAVEADLAARSSDLERDFQLRLSDVEKVLLDFERRGNAFFDERLRLMRIHELLSKERLRKDFETTVVADLPRQVEKRVEAMVDWMVGAELHQWQDVMERLGGRQGAHADKMVGRVDDRFEYDRQRLLEAVRSEAQRAIDGYDAPAEARRLAQNVRDSVAQTALLQVSAVGVGALVATLATTTAADVTGLVAAGALSVMGLFILPARRRRARAELATRVAALREKLLVSLTQGFERERDRGQQRVRDAIAPYSRFVRTEANRLREAESALAGLRDGLAALDGRVEGLAQT